MTTRIASHAGSWYSDDSHTLQQELGSWVARVDRNINGIGPIPQTGAKIIIAPHAGYAYSGETAAWAYSSLDLSNTKRIFLLGPSHHKYLTNCALSKHTHYATPLGSLPLDLPTISALRSTGQFADMSTRTDEDEHSLEMHLPYIYHILSASSYPIIPIVPILVGNTSPQTEKSFGALLAPYLADPQNAFIISSDFCHWGSRFGYTYYVPSSSPHVKDGHSLSASSPIPKDPSIAESIGRVDHAAMEAIETGSHDAFLGSLRDTENTVCGRHPIGVVMAAVECLKQEGRVKEDGGRFRFVRYARSSEVRGPRESSVSYASAFAVM